jgi:hypothetical protein
MGIRFHCPNGHKLNVKADLAGKRAICPDCGAKLIVPAVGANPAESSLQNLPAMAHAVAAPAVASQRSSTESIAPAALQPAASQSAVPQPVVWYVRPASGGQVGPLADAALAAQIADGRVVADTYLWRPGWDNWQLAADAPHDLPAQILPTTILPAPAALLASPSLAGDLPATLAEPVVADAIAAPTALDDIAVLPAAVAPRRKHQTPIAVTILLIFTILILVGVLIWVIHRNGGETAKPQAARIPIAAARAQS